MSGGRRCSRSMLAPPSVTEQVARPRGEAPAYVFRTPQSAKAKKKIVLVAESVRADYPSTRSFDIRPSLHPEDFSVVYTKKYRVTTTHDETTHLQEHHLFAFRHRFLCDATFMHSWLDYLLNGIFPALDWPLGICPSAELKEKRAELPSISATGWACRCVWGGAAGDAGGQVRLIRSLHLCCLPHNPTSSPRTAGIG